MLETDERFRTVIVEVPSKKGNWKRYVKLDYDYFLNEQDVRLLFNLFSNTLSLDEFRFVTTKGAQILNSKQDCLKFLRLAKDSDLITFVDTETSDCILFSIKDNNPKFLDKVQFYALIKSHGYFKSVKILPKEKSDNHLECFRIIFNDGWKITAGLYYTNHPDEMI